MNGYIGWQASPSNVIRPTDQRGSGSRSNKAQMKQVSAAAMIRRTCWCQPANAASARSIVARSVQSSRFQVSCSVQPTKFSRRAARDEIMHEMAAGADPGLAAELEAEIGDALDRHQPAIGDAAGEVRRLVAEQRGAHRRMDAVGADQHVGGDARAVVEAGLDAVAPVVEADQAVAEMDVLGREAPTAITASRSARCIVMCGAP